MPEIKLIVMVFQKVHRSFDLLGDTALLEFAAIIELFNFHVGYSPDWGLFKAPEITINIFQIRNDTEFIRTNDLSQFSGHIIFIMINC